MTAPVNGRLGRLLALLVAVLVSVAALSMVVTCAIAARGMSMRDIENARDEREGAAMSRLTVTAERIKLDVVQVQQFLTDVSATRGQDGLDDGWDEAAKWATAFQADLAAARRDADVMHATDVKASLDAVAGAFPQYYEEARRMAHAYVSRGPAEGNRLMPRTDAAAEALTAQMDAMTKALDRLAAHQESVDGVNEHAFSQLQQTSLIITLVGGLVVCAMSLMVLVVLRTRLLRPLGEATRALERLSKGDLDTDLAGAGRPDEVGDLARAFHDFRTALVEKRASETRADAERRAADADRAAFEADRAEADTAQKAAVAALAEALARLSRGELACAIDHAFDSRYEQLRLDFNDAVARLAEALQVVRGNAGQIRSGVSEMAAAHDDLSRRTEQAAASLEQTAAALDQITATVRKTAQGAKDANSTAAVARREAEASGQVVGDAVQAMDAIERSAAQIVQIIGVIDEIAFQTNLLALNAGVEAARAGDAGKGFAVVASEVRALAQRSAEAAKEIKGLIGESSAKVSEGVGLVARAGEALARIVEQVSSIDVQIADIAASAQEQATGLSEVNSAINQMDQVTQQNAAMVEQATAAGQALAAEARKLDGAVGRFQVGGMTSADAAPATPRPAPSAAPRTMLRAVSQVRADEAAWAEF